MCRPGTDTVLWSDTFDGYTSVAAMTSGTVPNYTSAGNVLLAGDFTDWEKHPVSL